MGKFMRANSRAYRTLEYMACHPSGLNARVAFSELGDMNLHSTISDLRNKHNVRFIRSRRLKGIAGQSKQYFIVRSDVPLARLKLGEAKPARKPISIKGGLPIGEA